MHLGTREQFMLKPLKMYLLSITHSPGWLEKVYSFDSQDNGFQRQPSLESS